MATRPYSVHLLDNARDGGLVLVRDGFSWLAFLFSVPWALYHRLWRVAGGLFVLQVALAALMLWAGLNEAQQGIVSLAVALAVGLAADEFRRGGLKRRGYAFEEIVMAENMDAATRRYLDARPDVAGRLAATGS